MLSTKRPLHAWTKTLGIVCLSALCAAPAPAQTYTIRALGPAPVPSTFSSVAKALNNKDEVLADGVFGPYSGSPSIFLPIADYGMRAGLDYLPFSGFTNITILSSPWVISTVLGYLDLPFRTVINDQGQILGTLKTPSHAAIWQNGHVTDLGTLGGAVSTPFALNQHGDVIGYSSAGSVTAPKVPFIYVAGTPQMQPVAGLDQYSQLIAFNNQRQILATSTNGHVVWQYGVAKDATKFFGFDPGPALVENPNQPGTYYQLPGIYNGVLVHGLNDAGEILGSLVTSIYTGYSYGGSAHFFIYSPMGGHGLQPGLNYDPFRYPQDMLVAWNRNGQLIYLADFNSFNANPVYYFSDQGHVRPLQDLVPPSSGWTDLTPYGINDRGEIVGQGSSNGVYQAFLLALPPLSVTVSATPSRATLGDQIKVSVTVVNNNKDSTGVLTNAQLSLPLTMSGTVGVKPDLVPAPVKPITLAPGASFFFNQIFIATNYGSVSFGATASAYDDRGIPIYAAGTSAPVNIKLAADLMVKSADPSDMVFQGIGEYQEVPSNDQNVTQPVGTNGAAGYVVRLLNGTTEARTFNLRGTTNSFPNWNIQATAGGVDVLDALTASSGWTTPQLDAGGSIDLKVSLAPGPNAGIQEHKSLLIQAFADDTSKDILDALLLYATLVPVPVTVTLHQVTASGLTPASIQAGTSDINAPLVPSTDPSQLAGQPQIHGGLVADGVTPLLFKLSGDPIRLAQFTNGYAFDVQSSFAGSGALAGNSLNDRLQALYNGVWAPSTGVVLSASSPIAYLQLPPVLSDDVLVSAVGPEVQCLFDVVDKSTHDDAGQVHFAVRKPPVALIHGYNTAGDWGADFKSVIGFSRPLGLEDSPNNFIRTVKYGQDVLLGLQQYVGLPAYVNTAWSLEDCAVLANNAFTARMAAVHENWAFTRFDVVAHSQGGLLTRMLCSANGNLTIRQPFRNADNFYRGRFHRVVTIGSPHNGTRLLRYLLDLNQRGLFPSQGCPASFVANLMVGLNIAQEKFDPFGAQIRELNDPSPGAPWQPDPAAQFHLVRSVIDLGHSPGLGDLNPSYIALGLALPGGGPAVIPRGSDGVVDFDSMGANVPPSPLAPNVFDLNPLVSVSHAGPTFVFGSVSGEVDSSSIALHVISALDEDQRAPAAGLVFGSFPLPPLLDDSQRALIDNYAASGAFKFLPNLTQLVVPSPGVATRRPKGSGSTSTFQYQLSFPATAPPQGNVQWFVEVFGPQGISSDGVSWSSSGSNSQQVAVTVAETVTGDVVLYANYLSSSNTVVSTSPQLVVSMPPPSVTLTGLQILPGSVSLPVGSVVAPRIIAQYSDGSTSLRYVPSAGLTASSTAPGVVSVNDPLNWQLLSPGAAQVKLTWHGITGTSQIDAFSTNSSSPVLNISSGGNGALALSWPAYGTPRTLQNNTNLSYPQGWHPVTDIPTEAGGQNFLTLPTTNAALFYRLRSQP